MSSLATIFFLLCCFASLHACNGRILSRPGPDMRRIWTAAWGPFFRKSTPRSVSPFCMQPIQRLVSGLSQFCMQPIQRPVSSLSPFCIQPIEKMQNIKNMFVKNGTQAFLAKNKAFQPIQLRYAREKSGPALKDFDREEGLSHISQMETMKSKLQESEAASSPEISSIFTAEHPHPSLQQIRSGDGRSHKNEEIINPEVEERRLQEQNAAAQEINSKDSNDFVEDAVVMDYAQPHRKPPIHNEEN